VTVTALAPGSCWSDLQEAVGQHNARRDVPASLLDDPTGLYCGSASGSLSPTDTLGVQAVIRLARRHRLKLVPRGGGTGLVGGAVARGDELVLDLSRIDAPLRVDPVEGTVTAGAGVTIARVQEALREVGLWLPLELGSWQSATVGGVVATNAGGTQVLRYGHVRTLLAGVEAVLGSGEIVSRLEGWRKDNNGPDLAGLLCGSEGTLGVITAATFRVVPRPTAGVLLGALFPDWAGLVEAAVAARDAQAVQAVEMLSHQARELLSDQPGLRVPFPGQPGHLLLLDVAGCADGEAQRIALSLEQQGHPVLLADNPTDRAALWAPRHALADAVRQLGRPHKLDLVVPLPRMSEFLDVVESEVQQFRPTALTVLFGHVGDGNVHVNLVRVADEDRALDDLVVDLAFGHGGHASAEHGIGTVKGRWLARTRSAVELALFEQLRGVCDPDGILNPRVFR
jgi:FAD/FMN-containing dehydrogenase